MCSYLKRQKSQPTHPGTMPAPCHTLAAFLVEGEKKRHKHDEGKNKLKEKGSFLSCQGAYIRFLQQSQCSPTLVPGRGTAPVN